MTESYINYIKLPNGDVAKFSLPNTLKVGKKTYDGSAAIKITAADLGLSQALKLVGVTSTTLVDGATTSPIVINGKSHTPKVGDVVLSSDKNSEFAWVKDNYWEELGSENSYALKTVTISAGNGLSGGGQLSSDVTLSANFGNISNSICCNTFLSQHSANLGQWYCRHWIQLICCSNCGYELNSGLFLY